VAAAGDRLVELKRPAPERVVAEIVKAEDLPPLRHQRGRVALCVDRPEFDEGRRVCDETALTLNSAPPASAQAAIKPPVRSTFRRRLDRSICSLLARNEFRYSKAVSKSR
jgi:hypothetical protein